MAEDDAIVIQAPLAGWAAPLAEVPDPVFAEKMLGDGLAIDPVVGELRAPCSGVVANVHAARHALTVRSDGGVEVLVHVGLETVALGGHGFEVLTAPGARVSAGEVLLRFDLELLAREAAALISPVIIANGAAFAVESAVTGRIVAFGAPILKLRPLATAPPPPEGSGASVRRALRVTIEHGLHARPAARLAQLAAALAAEVTLEKGGRSAAAASAVSVMTLGVGQGDDITIAARGPGAAAAADAVAGFLAGGPPPRARPPTVQTPVHASEIGPGLLSGVPAVAGIAIGPAARLPKPRIEPDLPPSGPAEEMRRLETAILHVSERLGRAGAGGDIFAAHLVLLADPELRSRADAAIRAGSGAGAAWRQAIAGFVELLAASDNPRLKERAADLADLETQVLVELAGAQIPPAQTPPGSILLAREVLPSELVRLDRSRLTGLAMSAGGPTSHTALLAAALELPTLVALGPALDAVEAGTMLLLDADAGLLRVDPAEADISSARVRLASRREDRALALRDAHELCRTADGRRIEILANLAGPEEAAAAVDLGAEGCGLLRTEFLFIGRSEAPSEEEQARIYQQVADGLGGRPLVIRSLDAGADKPVDFIPRRAEANPALGLRGVRLSLASPELFAAQLRAILRVTPAPAVMLPMVSEIDELRAAKALAQKAAAAIGAPEPRLGIMIETPAAAMTASLLAAEADFFSIGANDLTQYALAMDRTDAALAPRLDALHPAVLRLIRHTAGGAEEAGRVVAVCGAIASEPLASAILIGLGVTELSVAPAVIPELKATVRRLVADDCRDLAARALDLESAAQVRALAAEFSRDR
ncbi:MAG TPA: phosphoenolpyruvate--protein phosphotransferase [Caulobacteraceae bacterium]|nr:phosphoenolpyruvate--protein phosphotransferase [Caulobacteraceae bacterium]